MENILEINTTIPKINEHNVTSNPSPLIFPSNQFGNHCIVVHGGHLRTCGMDPRRPQTS